MGGEVITLQFGNASNYVGSHYFNVREEAYHRASSDTECAKDVAFDRAFRLRESKGGMTYVPRLVLVDRRGSLGSTSLSFLSGESGGAPDTAKMAAEAMWTEDRVEVERSPAPPKSTFVRYLEDRAEGSSGTTSELPDLRKLDDEVGQWTDFSAITFHPRSIHQLHRFQHDIHDFLDESDARSVLGRVEEGDELLDRIRYFAEDCDGLQGFQILVDTADAFQFLARDTLEDLQDDYGKKEFLTMGVGCNELAEDKRKQRQQLLNHALSLCNLSQTAGLHMPTRMGRWSKIAKTTLRPELLFHTSAVLAGVLDGVSLPYLRADHPLPMSVWQRLLGRGPRGNIVSSSIAFPTGTAPSPLVYFFVARARSLRNDGLGPEKKYPMYDIARSQGASWGAGGIVAESAGSVDTLRGMGAAADDVQDWQGRRLVLHHAGPLPLPRSFPHLLPGGQTSTPLHVRVEAGEGEAVLLRDALEAVRANRFLLDRDTAVEAEEALRSALDNVCT